jgi:hypothetical protein
VLPSGRIHLSLIGAAVSGGAVSFLKQRYLQVASIYIGHKIVKQVHAKRIGAQRAELHACLSLDFHADTEDVSAMCAG